MRTRTLIRCGLLLVLASLPAVVGVGEVVAAESPTLAVSTSSDRSGASPLTGATTAGDVYVFVPAGSSITRVRFWLDDPDRSGAVLKDERNGPWDLAGTAKDGSALPFDTTDLADGAHSVTALVTHGDGSTQEVHADFTVANSVASLAFSPGSLDLTSEPEGPALLRSVQVTSTTAASVTLASDQPWLTVDTAGGSTPLDVVVRADPAGLPTGTHTARVSASADGLAPATLTVTLRVAAPTGGPELMTSTSSTRSAAVPLAGATLRNDAFVFFPTAPGIESVRFWVDNAERSGTPYRTEKTAPYDLGGGTVDTAAPFDTRNLADGAHSVTALVTYTGGSTQVVHADFTVANSAASLGFTPASLSLSSAPDGPVLEHTVRLAGGSGAAASLVSDRPWLTVVPASGSTPLDVVVRVDPAGLAAGSHTGSVSASATGLAGATLPVTLNVVAPSTGAEIAVSQSSTRTPATALAGQTVRGDVFVFVPEGAGIASVRFWLDDPTGAGTPYRTENTAPFDLAGGTVTTAAPFDTTNVADGPHSVMARVLLTNGTTQEVRADFTVANHGPSLVLTPDRAAAAVGDDRPVTSFSTSVSATSGTPSVSAASDVPWLTVDPCCATTPATLGVTADPSSLSAGQHTGVVTVSAVGYAPATFTVQLTVSGGAPTQVHLAWVADPTTTMDVVWRTAGSVASRVEYRRAGTTAWTTATGAPRSFTGSGVLHEVPLTGLLPDTAYEYRVPGDGTARSPVHTFRTAPTAAKDFDVVYLADTGVKGRIDGLTAGTADVIEAVADLAPLAVLPGGDYAYFNTDKRFATQDDAMDAWFEQVEPFAANAPMMPTYGNHEVLLEETYAPWAARFPTPPGHDNRKNYSFDLGPVHFVSIYAVYNQKALTASQMSWLRADLSQAVASGRRWVVPYMHVSTFADGANHPSNLALRAQLGPVFEQYGVDLVLMSHDQSYERTYPLVDVPTANRPTSTRTDCVGKAEGVTWVKVSPAGKLSNKNAGFSPWTTVPAPPWTAVRSNEQHHFARLRVRADGDLRLDVFGLPGQGGQSFLVDTVRFAAGAC